MKKIKYKKKPSDEPDFFILVVEIFCRPSPKIPYELRSNLYQS